MKCPNCTDVELVNRRREWLSVDLCPQCQGTWLSRSEFSQLVMDAQRAQAIADDDWHRERDGRVVEQRHWRDYEQRNAYRDDERYRAPYRRKSLFEQFKDLID